MCPKSPWTPVFLKSPPSFGDLDDVIPNDRAKNDDDQSDEENVDDGVDEAHD
jgi:hypothetical protein